MTEPLKAREIKFRAWMLGQKKMFSAEEMTRDQMALLPDGHFANIHSTSTALSVIYQHDEMLPLQFTGLLDKNDKEIYEGDILQSEYTNLGDDGPRCHPVVWRNGRWDVDHSITDCCKPWRGDLNGHHISEEIIGNIYENSDLLS